MQFGLVSVSRVRGFGWKVTYPLRRWPRLSKAVLGGAALMLALGVLVAAANVYVLLNGDDSTSSIAEVPKAEVAIVPAALVQPDGKMSVMLGDRVKDAARLWHAGKVQKILVSGDHGQWTYDEPDTMREALVRHGVTPRNIFEDHAGFDTWQTMERARSIDDFASATLLDAEVSEEPSGNRFFGLFAHGYNWP